MKPVVLKYLDISTGHMTKKDNAILTKGPEDVICDKYEYGYRIHVSKDELKDALERMKKAGLSPDFRKIVKWAHKKGMDWVQFDADGTQYRKFTVHKW